MLDNLNARVCLGQTIDPVELGTTISAMVRVASRLGLRRRARDVTPTLQDYLDANGFDEDANTIDGEVSGEREGADE